jgi:hypothetical protein
LNRHHRLLTRLDAQLRDARAITEGAVSAILDFPRGTIVSGAYSSIPDALASNPAAQSTPADRPTATNATNGVEIADFDGSTDFLSWPAASGNNATNYAGFAAWLMPDIVISQHGIFVALPGATNKLELSRNNADFLADVYASQFSSRRGTCSNVFSAGVWVFVTWEHDKDGANDAAKCTMTANAVVLTPTFSNSSGTPNAMPTTLVSTVGPFLLGTRVAASHTGCWDGKYGPAYCLGSKMSAATQGLLTSTARTGLMNLRKPT